MGERARERLRESKMSTVVSNVLPVEFADLEQFSAWVLEAQSERYAKRLASTMAEMQTFYDHAFPRIQDLIAYCQRYPLDDMPDEARHVMRLVFSLIEVSFPVECWRQPRVPDSGAAGMICTRETIV